MTEPGNPIQPGFLRMPKLPVIGYFRRLLAFVLDLFIILSAIHLVVRVAPGIFWALGAWAPYTTAGGTFLYFALLNGPVGRGRTIGKLLLRMQVTDFDGNPPTFRQSIIRTVILIPLYVSVPLTEAFIGPALSPMSEYLKSLLTIFPFLAMLVATSLTIPFNPFKQGLHDFLAKTLVRPAFPRGQYPMTFEDMAGQVGLTWPKFHRQPQYSGGVTFAIILALLAFMGYPDRRVPAQKEFDNTYYALKKIPGMRNSGIRAVPIPGSMISETPYYDDLKEMGISSDSDLATTGTITLYVTATANGAWPLPVDSAEFRLNAEHLANTYDRDVIPLIIKNAHDLDADKLPPWYSTGWETESVKLKVLFLEVVALYPYPSPLIRVAGQFVKVYPPLAKDKLQSLEENSLDSDIIDGKP